MSVIINMCCVVIKFMFFSDLFVMFNMWYYNYDYMFFLNVFVLDVKLFQEFFFMFFLMKEFFFLGVLGMYILEGNNYKLNNYQSSVSFFLTYFWSLFFNWYFYLYD